MIFHVVLIAAFWAHTSAYDLASRSNRVRFPNHEPPPYLITADTVYEAAESQDAPSVVPAVKNYQNKLQHFPQLHHQPPQASALGPGGPAQFGGIPPKGTGPQSLFDGPPRPHNFSPFASHPPRPDNHPIKPPYHEAQSHQNSVHLNTASSQNYLNSPERYIPPGHSPHPQNLPVNGKPPPVPQKQLFKPTNYRMNPPQFNRDGPPRPPHSSPPVKLNGPRDDDSSTDYSSLENYSGPSSSSFEHFGPPRGPSAAGPGPRPRPPPQKSPNNDYFNKQPSRLHAAHAQNGPQYNFDVPSGFNKFGSSQEFNGPSSSNPNLEDSSEEFPEFDRLRSKWKLTFNEPSSEGFAKKKRPPQDVEETKQHYFKQGFKGGSSFSYDDDASDFDHSGPSSLHSSSSHKSESDNFFASGLKAGGYKRAQKEKPNNLNDYFDFSDMPDFGDFKSSSSDSFKFGSFNFKDFPNKNKKQSLGVPFSGSEWVPINLPKGGESSLKSYDIPSLESVAKEFNFPSVEVDESQYNRNSEYPRPIRNRLTTGSNIVYGGRKQSNRGGSEEVVSASLTVKQ